MTAGRRDERGRRPERDDDHARTDHGRASTGRCRGDQGTSYVLAMVVLFLTTGIAAIWLARDVNQRVSDRSALQSIAFQAARAGAQQIDVGGVRTGAGVTIDEDRATMSALATVERLAESYDVAAVVIEQEYGDDARTWTVTVGLLVDDGVGGQAPTGASTAEDPSPYGAVVTGVAHAEVGG